MRAVAMDPPLCRSHPATLNPADIDHLMWQAVPGCPGVRAKELWRSTDAACVLLSYGPDAATPGGPHPHARQHIWVLAGGVVVDGRRLVAGSYIDVPAGVAHPINTVSPSGALLLQVDHWATSASSQDGVRAGAGFTTCGR